MIRMSEGDNFEEQRRKIIAGRNRMLGLVLAGLAILFFLITIAKMKH